MDDAHNVNRPLTAEEVAALATDGAGKVTPENDEAAKALIESLQGYHKAFEEEFKNVDANSPEAVAAARKQLFTLIPDAGATIQHLMNHAQSEAVRANLAKFVYAEALRVAKAEGEGDEMSRLINSLTKDDE